MGKLSSLPPRVAILSTSTAGAPKLPATFGKGGAVTQDRT